MANLQWVVTAYSLTFGGLLLLGGRLADLFGRRRILLVGLVLFTGASLLGGFSQNQATLIAARALQGVGAAVLSPATLTILTVTFTEQRARAKALGVWSAVAAGGGAAGALFGGILTQYLSWRWILFVNVPIGIVLFVLRPACTWWSRGPRAPAGGWTWPARSPSPRGLMALVYTIVHTDEVAVDLALAPWSPWAIAAVLLGAFVAHRGQAGQPSPGAPPAVPVAGARRGQPGDVLLRGGHVRHVVLPHPLPPAGPRLRPVVTGFTFLPQTAAIAVGATISRAAGAEARAPATCWSPGPCLAAGGLYWLSFIQAGDTYWNSALRRRRPVPPSGWAWPSPPSPCPPPAASAARRRAWPRAWSTPAGRSGASLGLAVLSTVAASHISSLLAGRTVTARARTVAMTAGYARGLPHRLGGGPGRRAVALIIPGQNPPPMPPRG